MRLKGRLILLALMVVAACGTDGPRVVHDFCLLSGPILFRPEDRLTEQTEADIIKHNEKGAEICGWRPPAD
jgi:predicted small lipoprotein YifL